MLKRIIAFSLILGLMVPLGVHYTDINFGVTMVQAKEKTKKVKGVKIKETKVRQMNTKQLEKLLNRIDKAREKGDGAKVKMLKQKYKNKKKNLKEKWKESLKNPDLSKAEKKLLREEFKAQKTALKSLNEELKKDLDRKLSQSITPQELESIEFVEPNFLYELQGFTDPRYAEQWGLQSVGVSGIPKEQNNTEDTIVVAVVDSGVNFSHPDLGANKWVSSTCVDANNEPIPGGCLNGGYDFVDNDNDPFPTDNINHGSAVASVIGAETNNGEGMASVGQNDVQIMSVRACCTAEGFFEVSEIEEGIRFAVNNGAQVINASFGGPTYSQQLEDAIQYAEDNGVLVIAAAGNYATDNDTSPMYPANLNQTHTNVLSVGSTTSWDHLAYFSNFGVNTVDIAAPGQDVLVAVPTHYYQALSGTSFSAPLVSGVVAQMMQGSDWDYLNIKNLLLQSVQTLPSLDGKVSGSKVLRFDIPEIETPPTEEEENNTGNGNTGEGTGEETTDPEPEITDEEEAQIDEELTEEEQIQVKNTCKGLPKKEKKKCKKQKKLQKFCSKEKNYETKKCIKFRGETTTAILPNSVIGDLIFHHEDHLTGSNVDTDSSGNVVQLLDYFPYGGTRVDEHSNDYQNDYKFTGKERDEETNLDYYESRYYNSDIARFISVDPWEGDMNDPQSFNKYSYVFNNPIKYVDPTGEEAEIFIRLEGPLKAKSFNLSEQFGHSMIRVNDRFYGFAPTRSDPVTDVQDYSSSQFGRVYNGQNWNSMVLNTTEQQDQKIVNYYEELKNSGQESITGEYRFRTNNCTQICHGALQEAGVLPRMPRAFAPRVLYEGLKALSTVETLLETVDSDYDRLTTKFNSKNIDSDQDDSSDDDSDD